MGKRRLGRTDIRVSPIGLGTWQFSEGQGMHRFSYSVLVTHETNDIVEVALDRGINWFDTAEFYGNGRSERGLSQSLQAAGKGDGDVVIATKWWPFLKTARSIRNTIGKRLASVDVDSTEVELGQLDTELQRRRTAPLTLDQHLESIVNSLNSVHEHLWHEPVQVRLNRMGIKSEQDDDSAVTLQLNEYCNADGNRIIALPVQIPFDSIPVRQDMLSEIDRYL